MNKLSCRVEELGDVEGGFVISLHTVILDVCITVVISTSQHIVPLPLSCVKNMCYTQISQTRTLQSCFPKRDLASHCSKSPVSLCVCVCLCLLTRLQYRYQARPGRRVCTELRVHSRKAVPDPMFQVWCNHCLGPPAPPCTGSCFWTSPPRTWLTSDVQVCAVVSATAAAWGVPECIIWLTMNWHLYNESIVNPLSHFQQQCEKLCF